MDEGSAQEIQKEPVDSTETVSENELINQAEPVVQEESTIADEPEINELFFADMSKEPEEEFSPKEKDFYQKLRVRIRAWGQSEEGKSHKWTEYILLAPDLFHLLCRLTIDPDVMLSDKLKVVAAIAYFISPFDFIPEILLGPVGFVDDIVIAAYVLNSIVNNTDPEVVRRNWAGDGEILDLAQDLIQKAEAMIGAGKWQKLKNMFDRGVNF